MRKILFLLHLIILIGRIVSGCSNIFQYDLNNWAGLFELSARAGGTIKVDVQLTVATLLGNGNTGSLKLRDDPQVTQNRLFNGLPIRYNLVFPTTGIVPKITQIAQNGQVICSGHRDIGSPVTTIKLSHTFFSSQPVVNRIFTPAVNSRPQYEPIYIPPRGNRITLFNFSQAAIDYHNGRRRPEVVRPFHVNLQTTPSTTQRPPLRVITPTTSSTSDIQCGTIASRFMLQPLVFKGAAVNRGTWPWLVAIFSIHNTAETKFQCGGTLVSAQAVISAAHCFITIRRNQNVILGIGRHQIQRWTEPGSVVAQSSEIIIHPNYRANSQSFDADIAIIKLENRVSFTEFIRPACIWSETVDSKDIEGKEGLIAGWGRTEESSFSEEPLKAQEMIVSEQQCFNVTPNLLDLTTRRSFCAGKLDGSGPCTGDSGSGLLIQNNGNWFLRGIVSSRIDVTSCISSSYVIYTDVAQFRSWIDQKMNNIVQNRINNIFL